MVNRFYKGQALAIVMVVIVVASIIGIALFSRMTKDRQMAINQQDSVLAKEQADAILDLFIGADIDQLESAVVLGAQTFNDIGSMTTFLESIGVDSTDIPTDYDWCESASNSGIRVTASMSEDTDFIELQPGSVRAYDLEGATFDPSFSTCNLRLGFRSMSDYAIFVVKRVFNEGGVYSESDQKYCIPNGTDGSCGDVASVEYESNLESLTWNTTKLAYHRDVNLFNATAPKALIEVRVIPLYGTLAVSDYIEDAQLGCITNKEFRSIKVSANVTCNGSFRGREMFLPGSGNYGYSPLFDYAIYDNGLFQP
jgi:hypothetical protein